MNRVICGFVIIWSVVGCTPLVSSLPGVLPSLAYCDEVAYVRKGNQIDVAAKCKAPIAQ